MFDEEHDELYDLGYILRGMKELLDQLREHQLCTPSRELALAVTSHEVSMFWLAKVYDR